MKHFLLGSLLAAAALLAAAPSAHAQAATAVTIHVAHDFVAGKAALHAGEYRISYDLSGAAQVLTLRDARTGKTAFVLPLTKSDRAADLPTVTFRRVGEVYYLSEVATDLGVYTLPQAARAERLASAALHDSSGGN